MGDPIRSKAVKEGRNFDIGSYPDDQYVRCSRCGWINNLSRDIHSPEGSYLGWGTTFTTVSSTDSGSGFGPNSPADTMQTPAPPGQVLYSSSYGATDVLTNSYGDFSFNPAGVVFLGVTTTGSSGVMLLLFNSNMYLINKSSQWFQYTGSWVSVAGDPRLNITNSQNYDSEITWNSGDPYDCDPYVETTLDAVVGGGCAQCGTFLYNK